MPEKAAQGAAQQNQRRTMEQDVEIELLRKTLLGGNLHDGKKPVRQGFGREDQGVAAKASSAAWVTTRAQFSRRPAPRYWATRAVL